MEEIEKRGERKIKIEREKKRSDDPRMTAQKARSADRPTDRAALRRRAGPSPLPRRLSGDRGSCDGVVFCAAIKAVIGTARQGLPRACRCSRSPITGRNTSPLRVEGGGKMNRFVLLLFICLLVSLFSFQFIRLRGYLFRYPLVYMLV